MKKRKVLELIKQEALRNQGPPGPPGPQGVRGPEGPAGAAGAVGLTTNFVTTSMFDEMLDRVEQLKSVVLKPRARK